MEHLGLVGLPDSGHAQLYSALTGIDTPTGFETTKGVAPLPDDRVDRLAEMSKSKKRVHGTPVYRSDLTTEERSLLGPVFLLTNKPMLVVVNVAVDHLDRADELAAPFGPDALSVCVEIEGDPDVAQAPPDERAALLADLGVSESVLPRLARSAYHLLGRRTFFTTGEDESRAWSFRAGAKAPECAGVIHSDLQRGFIRAEAIDWEELLEIGSWAKAKEAN